jgi:hypothetical protein
VSTSVSSFSSVPSPKPRRKRRLLKLVLCLLGIAAALAVPPIYRSVIWAVIQEEGFRQGSFVKIGEMSGSLWEPLVLKRVRWGSEGFFRGRLGVEVDRIECVFRWENLLRRSMFWRVWERMELKGLRVKWDELEKAPGRRGEFLSFGPPLRIWIPDRMIFEVKTAGLAALGWNCQMEESALELSTLAPGHFKVGRLAVQVGSWSRTFRDLKGPASLKGERLNVGGVRLETGVEVTDAMVDLSELEQAKLSLELHSKAFGGELRAQGVAGLNSPSGPLEVSGTFSKIGVAPLAAFLGVTEAAGGVLEEGKFSFRGSPRFPRRGTASLRLEARNFQWESRQWDSLVVGATLLDRRVQVPEFSLRQGHNELQLSGDVLLPGGEGSSWWRSDFGMNVTARIGDLTELSALLLPEFKYTAGTLSIDGAIRSQNGLLGGALIVTGSRLMWRKAPIEEFNAAIKLDGNDIRVLSAELVNRADRIKAKGVLHVGDSWWYDAELRAAVGDLGNYADLLQPPLVNEAVSGQAFLEWSGKGSAWGHEGLASGRFSGMRPLKARPGWPNAFHGDFEGSYGAEGVKLRTISLGDGTVSVRSKLSATWEGVRLEELRFQKGDQVALEGSLLIPGAVWTTWPVPSWDRFLAEESPLEMDLRLDRLQLADLRRLPWISGGWSGEISGQWKTRGPFSKWSGEGALSVREGVLSLGSVAVRGLGMDLKWEGRRLELKNLGWNSQSGRYEGGGLLEWKESQKEPEWTLSASCASARWQGLLGEGLGAQMEARGRSQFQLSGPRSSWRLTGNVVLEGLQWGTSPEVRWWWAEPSAARRLNRPQSPSFLRHARMDWKLVTPEGGLVLGEGLPASVVNLAVQGSGGAPEFKGEVQLSLAAQVQGNPVVLGPLSLQFPGGSVEPQVEARLVGVRGQTPFRASAVGPLNRVVREYQADPPLSAEAVRAVFEEGKPW